MPQEILQKYLDAGYQEPTAKILYHREIDPETAILLKKEPEKLFLNPSYLPAGEMAAEEINFFLNKKEDREIHIFADYDVDGLTSGYILANYLERLDKCPIYPYFPERAESYGLSLDYCERLIRRKEETEKDVLLITVDNGVTQLTEVAYLKEHGIQTIVTDHHEPKNILPEAIVVDPHIEPKNPLHHLAGCGVVYKLCQLLNDCQETPLDLKPYWFAVAIGTVADMMPMTIENIAFTLAGLKELKKNNQHAGFKQFLSKMKLEKGITPIDISFEIAPRLNACGRMGDIEKAWLLFFVEKGDDINAINELIDEIEDLNQRRKTVTQRFKNELLSFSPPYENHIMYDISGYPDGIAAIAAGTMANQFNVPSIAYSSRGDGYSRGSARSVYDINLLSILEEAYNRGLVQHYGGHKAAAGISFPDEKLEELNIFLDEMFKKEFENLQQVELEHPGTLLVDDILYFNSVKKTVYENIHQFPFDRSVNFPEPLLAFGPLRVMDTKTSKNNPENIKFTVEDPEEKKKEIWAWGFGTYYEKLGNPEHIYLVGSLAKDFMSPKNYTIRVQTIVPTEIEIKSPEKKKKKLIKKKKKHLLKI